VCVAMVFICSKCHVVSLQRKAVPHVATEGGGTEPRLSDTSRGTW
jgi:hypothetical protein